MGWGSALTVSLTIKHPFFLATSLRKFTKSTRKCIEKFLSVQKDIEIYWEILKNTDLDHGNLDNGYLGYVDARTHEQSVTEYYRV